MDNSAIYLQKALDAVECVFQSEYKNSLGIPMPEIKLLLADDKHYTTGEYYITIGNTWQIHLNFGKLPVSFAEFQEEVKVLTRHEIGHYMCCPFDTITYFRMLKCILSVYDKEFKHLDLQRINSICGDIANQAADIIVDSRNFYFNPKETVKSEINWILKCGGIENSPRHSKLMFLMKEAIWKTSLNIYESDTELKDIVSSLANTFLEDGIENKSLFTHKTEEYARVFFQLFIKDKNKNIKESNDQQQSGQQQSGQQQSGQQQSGQQQSGQRQNGQRQSGQQQNGQQQSEQEINGSMSVKPKDGDKDGNALIFLDPEKVKDALEQLASETTISEFERILSAAGLNQLSEKDKEKLWFSVQSAGMIPIEEVGNEGAKDNYTYPTNWRIGDSIADLDMMLTYSTAPKLIPGITTKKWEQSVNEYFGVEQRQKDALLVVDTSGSMGAVSRETDNMHQAVLAAFGILNYFESRKGKIALVEFSDNVKEYISWTNEYERIRDKLLTNGSGGTQFPIHSIREILEQSKNELITVIITDGELGNINESVTFFEDYLNDENKLYVFLLGNSKSCRGYDRLAEIGAKVYQADNAIDFCDMVMDDLN
jgi:hypothetical protein